MADAQAVSAGKCSQKMWYRLIVLQTKQGLADEVLQSYWQMRIEGVEPNEVTFASVLKACSMLRALGHGRQIHIQGHESWSKKNRVVANSMLNMYAQCGDLNAADKLFGCIPNRNLVSWNSLIGGYVQHGQAAKAFELLHRMLSEGIKPNEMTHASILKACTSIGILEIGQLIHVLIIEQGYERNNFLANSLIDLYSKHGSIMDSRQVFDGLPGRDVVSWTSMITGYANTELAEEALVLFQQMHSEGVQPNECTFVSILNGCASLGDLGVGKRMHIKAIGAKYDFDNVVSSTLINMYAKCGSIQGAQEVFAMMPRRCVIPWTMMMGAHLEQGTHELAILLYGQMRRENLNPDASTFVIVLKACAGLDSLPCINELHSHVVQSNRESNVFIRSTLVDIYSKCGSIEDAGFVFSRMQNRDVVSWTIMIEGYVHHGESEKALSLFWQMQNVCVEPNKLTFVAALNACANYASVENGRLIHSYLVMHGLESDVSAGNTVIEFYVKGGSLEDACRIFDAMPKRNFVSWTTIIGGYGQHGFGKEALQLLHRMQLEGLELDGITFTAVLSACSRNGLVEEGVYQFDSMVRDYGMTPNEEHYSCMVDMLGRTGCLMEAQELIKKSPIVPSAVLWRSLLSVCHVHGNLDIAQEATTYIHSQEPHNMAACILLSNLYASAARVEPVRRGFL